MTSITSSLEVHRYFITILEHHLDFFGHVNNATYFQLLEEARWDMITARGCGVVEIKTSNIGPVVLEAGIRFKRELTLRQKISIETRLISLKGSIFKLNQTIINDTKNICCEADFTCGFFDLAQRKLCVPPKHFAQAFGFGGDIPA